MSVGRPLYNVHQRTCPKCGALQTSPGSTVCEQCGTDLRAASVSSSAPRRLQIRVPRIDASRIGGIFRTPVQLLGRGISALLSFVFFLLRIGLKVSVVLLVIGSLVVGLSYIPAVSARVPATKQVTRTAKNWLQGAGDWASGLLASARGEARPTQRTTSRTPGVATRPPASTQRPAATRPAATQSFRIRSSPTGATVRLNARSVGKTPLTIKVAPGTYKVMISRPGYVTITRTVTVQRGKAAALTVTLAAAKRSPAPAPRRTTPPPTQPKAPQPPPPVQPPPEQGAPGR